MIKPSVLSICSDSLLSYLFRSSSLSLEFTLSLSMLYLSPFCQRHNSSRRSLFILVLCHFGTHYPHRHMVGCGSHEILIQPCTTVLFLANVSVYSIQLWFWWLSYWNHSFQLIIIQYSVHHSDPARNHQSCYQGSFISTSNWRQAHIQRHIPCRHSNKLSEFIANTVHRILTH